LSGRFRRPCTIGVHGLFCHYDPVANTPVFLGLTADDSPQTRRAVARKALILSFIIILVFCAAGKLIFDLFGITLPAFRITGGLLVLLVGFHMLQGDHFSVQHPSEEDKQQSKDAQLEVAISPLALPILAGPGTIATAMNYASAGGVSEFGITIAAFFLLCLITYVFFVSGERFVSYIGVNGIKVITRIMGLILAVIGTQMVIAGVDGAVKLAQAA
jgi:multiple antibiotic resistance protein